MILFVFEGQKEENIFGTLKRLYWGTDTVVVAVYGCNIDALYHELVELGEEADIAALLMERYRGKRNNPFSGVKRSDEFSEIYLIFDYDFHDIKRSAEMMNEQLSYLLDFFNEETDKGKLYINYPMLEAIVYTKLLPDKDFWKYTVTREECRKFKQLTHVFSAYPNYKFITNDAEAVVLENWRLLKEQHVAKAEFMCAKKTPLTQKDILQAQIQKYECLEGCRVAILSAFALLIFDWLGH